MLFRKKQATIESQKECRRLIVALTEYMDNHKAELSDLDIEGMEFDIICLADLEKRWDIT